MRSRSFFLSPFSTLHFPSSILLLAFALRVYRLNHHDIWGDEAFSIWLSKQPLHQVVAGGADTHPPLYPLLLFGWLRVAGDSSFATRFLSVIPGVLLVAVVHVLGCRLLSRRAGLLAAGLTAVSPFAVYYSQETRMYAWAATLSALSVYAFLLITQSLISNLQSPISSTQSPIPNTQPPAWYLVYILATLAAVYTHYYAFFVLLAQNAFLIADCGMIFRNSKSEIRNPNWRRLRRFLPRWFATQAGIGLAYVPWVLIQMSFLQGKAHTRFEAWGLSGMRDVWARTLTAFGLGTTVPPSVEWLVAGLLLVVGVGAATATRRRLGRMTVLYLVVPLGGAWLVNPIMPFFYERYLIVALPAYLLLLAAGLLWLGRRQMLAATLGVALVLVASGYSLYNYYAEPAYTKGGYGRLMTYVENHARPGDALLLENLLQTAIYDYYAPQNVPAHWFPPEHPWDDPRTRAQLESLARRYSRLWLIMFGNPAEYDPNHELERWLTAHGFRSYHGDYVDASLTLYTMGQTDIASEEVRANFADKIELLGYSLYRDVIPPGETLELTLNWQALTEMDKDYTIFTHLITADQTIWAQMDSQPQAGTHPTSSWVPGERVADRFGLQLDPDTPPGAYQIEVGWYDLSTLQRLPVVEPAGQIDSDRVLLGPVHVTGER
ncbi:MAG: glycosyltransferase family 39 protein [Anaerolineae bacterium]